MLLWEVATKCQKKMAISCNTLHNSEEKFLARSCQKCEKNEQQKAVDYIFVHLIALSKTFFCKKFNFSLKNV